jgi:L-amino acid N-acyltransferase YncA
MSTSISYAISELGLKPHNLVAKIGSANTPSIRLFEHLGFKIVKRVEVWDEVELRWRPEEPEAEWEGRIPEGRVGQYTT